MPRPTRELFQTSLHTGLSPSMVELSSSFWLVVKVTGLVRVRSPLLTESRLMSFPPVTEMFQFTGFASHSYGFTVRYGRSRGFPHSEIPGSTGARPLPGLIAACHVLHRLSVPRHSPNALLVKLHHIQPQARAHAVCTVDLPDSCRSGLCQPFTGLNFARSQVGRLAVRSGKTRQRRLPETKT